MDFWRSTDTRTMVSVLYNRRHLTETSPVFNQTPIEVTLNLVLFHSLHTGMITKLSLDDRGDDASFVSAVAKSLFGDGTTNWGRVVSLVAFGAVVSQYLKEKSRENCVEQVAKEISTYLLTEQRDWLVKNNSWVSFFFCFYD